MTLGKVGLFGAAGAIGQNMAPVLDARGIPYRAVGRDEPRLRRLFPNAETVCADFLTGDGAAEAATGIDTIFYLAGAPYTHFEQHPVMTRNALAGAKRAGVSRFVHIAPVYSYGPSLSPLVPESQPHVPNTRKGRFRLEQEQEVFAAHGRDMRTLVVHLPDFYGPYAENSFANYFLNEAITKKTATFIGPLDALREFVFVPDVPAPILELAQFDDAYGRCWNLAAAGSITGREFTGIAIEALGNAGKVKSVSKIELQLFGLINPLMREVAEMFYLYTSGFILDDSNLNTRLGGPEKTPYDVGIRRTLDWMKQEAVRD